MHPLFIWLFVFPSSAVTSDTKAIVCRLKKANILLSGSCCDGEGNRIIFCLSPLHSWTPLLPLYGHIQGERGGTWLNKLPANGPVELWEFMGIAVGLRGGLLRDQFLSARFRDAQGCSGFSPRRLGLCLSVKSASLCGAGLNGGSGARGLIVFLTDRGPNMNMHIH